MEEEIELSPRMPSLKRESGVATLNTGVILTAQSRVKPLDLGNEGNMLVEMSWTVKAGSGFYSDTFALLFSLCIVLSLLLVSLSLVFSFVSLRVTCACFR